MVPPLESSVVPERSVEAPSRSAALFAASAPEPSESWVASVLSPEASSSVPPARVLIPATREGLFAFNLDAPLSNV